MKYCFMDLRQVSQFELIAVMAIYTVSAPRSSLTKFQHRYRKQSLGPISYLEDIDSLTVE